MDRFDAGDVVGLMESVGGERLAGRSVEQLVARAGQRHNRVAGILASLLEREGHTLPEAVAEALTAFRHRRARYSALLAELRRRCAGLYHIKGFHLEALYPAAVLRDANDLDLVVPDHSELHAAVVLLESCGFAPRLCGIHHVREGFAFHVAMVRDYDPTSPHVRGDFVELANYSLVGSRVVPPSFADVSGVPNQAVVDILAILRERFEQPFRSRDVLDVGLAVERLGARDTRDLSEAAVEHRVAPELAELVRTLRRCGLLAEAERLPRMRRLDVSRELARRARRHVRHVASLQALVSTRAGSGRGARSLWRLAGSGLLDPQPIGKLMRLGLRATGRHIVGPSSLDIELDQDVARTPAGTFELSTRPVEMLAAAWGYRDPGA